MNKQLVTASEATKLLGVSRDTLDKWVYLNKISCLRTEGGHRRYIREEIQKLINAESRVLQLSIMGDRPELFSIKSSFRLLESDDGNIKLEYYYECTDNPRISNVKQYCEDGPHHRAIFSLTYNGNLAFAQVINTKRTLRIRESFCPIFARPGPRFEPDGFPPAVPSDLQKDQVIEVVEYGLEERVFHYAQGSFSYTIEHDRYKDKYQIL